MQQGYLPHLDGLRAIAVGLVVLYHAGFSGIGAGYLGVDVFFVLSGFLITGQLAKNMNDSRFSFSQFYMRRVRRLAPAYITVAVVTLVGAAFIMLPDDLVYHGRLTALAMLSLSNFYLANTTGGYFESDTDEIALLHTWSLAVEEQYYLVWPVIMLLLWRLPDMRTRLALVIGLLGLTWLFSGWYTQVDPQRAYYLLPARFHELLLGASLALAGQRLPAPSRGMRELMCWAGLLLIVWPALSWTSSTPFPGWRAILPCFGTALLVHAGRESSLANWLLTRPVMTWLGMLSYSLYLWHWPVFSLMRYATGELTVVMGCAGIALSLLLSHLTWRFVEQPFRFRWLFTPRQTFARLFFIPTFLFALIVGALDLGDGFVNRFPADTRAKIEAMESTPSKFRFACPDDNSAPCADILLAGDSHAEHFGDFINVFAQDAGMTMKVIWRPGCPALPGLMQVYVREQEQRDDPGCREHTEQVLEQVGRYKYVLLAGYWSITDIKPDRYFMASEAQPQLTHHNSIGNIDGAMREAIERIIAAGATPVIVHDNPTAGDLEFKCSRRNLLPFHKAECTFDRAKVDQQQSIKRKMFGEIAQTYPQVRFIDPNLVLCDEQQCATELDGVPLFRDDDHLNRIGAEWLGQKYLERFGNPFGESAGRD